MNREHLDIVFIGYAPLTVKTAQDFFIDDLIAEKINVQYIDLSLIYFPQVKLINELHEDWIVKITSLKALAQIISLKRANTIYFINFPYESRVFKVFRLLTVFKCNINIIAKGMLPMPPVSRISIVNKLFRRDAYKKVINVVLNHFALILKKKGFVKSFDKIYYAGHAALKIAGVGYQIDINSAELIEINSSDYDNYLMIKEKPEDNEDKYILFLDEYLPFHPDFAMLGIKTVEPENYYRILNEYFDRLEKKYGLRVVIAAHPKAELYLKNDFFNGRELIFNRTGDLVRNCHFVVAHMSTSISYAILFKKVIIFAVTNDIANIMQQQAAFINNLATVLEAKVINMDDDSLIDIDPLSYSELRYNEYKNAYLTTSSTGDTLSREIFLNTLR